MLFLKLLRNGGKTGHIALEAKSWQALADQAATLFPLNTSQDFNVLTGGRVQPLRLWMKQKRVRDPWKHLQQQPRQLAA